MPLKKVEFYADKQTPLPDMVVKAPINPYLVLSLSDESLLKKVHCFSSLEGAISSEILAGKLWVRGTKNFSAGRIKINCTAASSEAGRYFWYTQLWLAADKNGNWTYDD
jgi:hypothetical protein